MTAMPRRRLFHARNRLISGLSQAVVVIEANEKSGALITARHAVEQGRELFVLPANVDNICSAGSLSLLRQGARLIRHADDLLQDLALIDPLPHPSKVNQKEATTQFPEKPRDLEAIPSKIWDLLCEPKHIDDIARQLQIAIAICSQELFGMELKKQVKRLPGNMYERW